MNGADLVLIANEDEDVALVPRAQGGTAAQTIADQDRRTITVRDPVTDEVLGTFTPHPA